MKIFLTGGSGMVGRNILEHPKAKNYQIVFPTSQELNLLNRDAVRQFMLKEEPDLVIHAAARVGGIQANIANPVGFLRDNIDMGLNVILTATSANVPSLINLSCSCMYPREALNPLSESLILKGELEPTNEGTALAKIVSTKLCEYISRKDKSKKYKTIIPCNLYGRHDEFSPEKSHLIPAIIRKIHEAQENGEGPVTIWGDGTARREFMCVKDLADFVFFGIEHLDKMPQNINVGLGHDHSIRDYYNAVSKVIGYKGEFIYDLERPVGMRQKLVDIEKLNRFGWIHKTSLVEGIQESYEFYKEELKIGI
jgi:GDP-L-fucose synthase